MKLSYRPCLVLRGRKYPLNSFSSNFIFFSKYFIFLFLHDSQCFLFFLFSPLHLSTCVCLFLRHPTNAATLPSPVKKNKPGASGRRGSRASDTKARSKSRARSKSPFRSFRWPKKTRPEAASAAHYSDDEDHGHRTLGKRVRAQPEGVRWCRRLG